MKHLISLTELNKAEISQIVEVAQQMRRIVTANYKRGPQLIGSVVAGVWPKPCLSSTAFSLAASYLSGTPYVYYNMDDVMSCCKMLDNMGANTIVVSCENDNLAKTFATSCTKNVINGGSGQYDPIGVLADLMALSIRCDGLHNLSVLAVGNRDTNKINEYNHCLGLFGTCPSRTLQRNAKALFWTISSRLFPAWMRWWTLVYPPFPNHNATTARQRAYPNL